MKISTKGRYALRVMVCLAQKDPGAYIPLKEIAEAEHISQKYLERLQRVIDLLWMVPMAHIQIRPKQVVIHYTDVIMQLD